VTEVRGRLLALWISQTIRALADGCLGGALLLHLGGQDAPAGAGSSWLLGAGIVLAALLGMAPSASALDHHFGRRRVLAAAAALSLGAVVLRGVFPEAWPVWFGVLAAGAALHGPARDALLPAAAQAADCSLPRVVAAMRLGTAAAAAAGLALAPRLESHGGPAGLVPGAAALLALLTALPAHFPIDHVVPGARRLLPGGPAAPGPTRHL
jgi:MFS family permease